MEPYITGGLATLGGVLGGAFGGYLAGYMNKKGENLATHEDIDKLVDQVRAVTTATEQIKAEISSDVWDRQKLWELKREVLFNGVRRMAETEECLLALDSILQVETKEPHRLGPNWAELKTDGKLRWGKASASIDESKLFINVTCNKETTELFEKYVAFTNVMGVGITSKRTDFYTASYPELTKNRSAVRAAIRKELGTDSPG